MDKANLPAVRPQSSMVLTKTQVGQLKIADRLVTETPEQIAWKLAKGDKQKMKRWRTRMRQWATHDPFFQQALALATQAEMSLGLPMAGRAVVRRAARGYPPAIKILFEATGFHNPKQQVEHSGEIKITMSVAGGETSIPRPPRTEDMVDAEVVEG